MLAFESVGTFFVVLLCDKLLEVKSKVETKEMLTDGVGAIALIGHVASELSASRRQQLKPSLRTEFHTICANNAATAGRTFYLGMTWRNEFAIQRRQIDLAKR